MWIFHYSVLMVWMMLVDLCNFNVFGARRCPFRSPSSSRRGMSHEVTGTNQNMQFAVHESKIVVAQRTSCCQDRKNSEICCEVSALRDGDCNIRVASRCPSAQYVSQSHRSTWHSVRPSVRLCSGGGCHAMLPLAKSTSSVSRRVRNTRPYCSPKS